MRIILLGPQRSPTVGSLVRSLPPDGPVATITAGWREREPDDDELSALLGTRDVNLGLYRRWLDVQDRDPLYAAGLARANELIAERQEFYLLRLDHALQAVYALQRPDGGGRGRDRLREDAAGEAVAAVRELDQAHLRHVNEVRAAFFAELRPHDRPEITGHRAAIAATLRDSAALVIAGGHVGVLADVLHLFNVAAGLNSEAPVIAWSAGAMALTDRIVLFGDRSARGPGHAEVYGSGLSLLRDAVLLPHARARLLLDDAPRMAVFARRFAPARCVLLESGTRLDLDPADSWPPGARMLAPDGHVTELEAA